jgi:deazaflavin-dependent oxidoreductase (nitroreductase family)
MPSVHYRPFHALIQKIAATPAGSRALSRILYRVDPFVLKYSGGRRSLTGLLAGVPVVTVITIGARTGLPRTSPLLPVRDPADASTFAIIASNFGQQQHPSWYFNLKRHPRATCTINGQAADYLAHEATGEEYERYWRYATDTYFGYDLYKRRAGRRIPIMVLTPLKS